jgi:hypothetical protein
VPYDPQEGTKIWFESLNHTAKTNLVVVQTRDSEGFGPRTAKNVTFFVTIEIYFGGYYTSIAKRHIAGKPGVFSIHSPPTPDKRRLASDAASFSNSQDFVG